MPSTASGHCSAPRVERWRTSTWLRSGSSVWPGPEELTPSPPALYLWPEGPQTARQLLRNAAAGTVALAEAWAGWTDTLGQVSDNESQFSERGG